MKSVCVHHYPQITCRNGQRMLWNPVMKKPAVNLPEERVRLRFVEVLLLDSTISPARIATEKGLDLGTDQAGRTDILCYDRNVEPLLLIECKNEKIRLDEAAAIQIGRYNYQIGAPYMVLTNGNDDFWFRRNDDSLLTGLDVPPVNIFPGNKTTDRDAGYWIQRGFIGRETEPELQNLLAAMLTASFAAGTTDIRFLQIPPSKKIRDLAHYYLMQNWPDEKLSIGGTCISDQNGATRMVAVVVHNEEPLALLEVNPAGLKQTDRPNAFMRARGVDDAFNITGKTGWTLQSGNPSALHDFIHITRTLLLQNEMLAL
ncbi:MAG: type I restriction enzyme HsdR N-terminal domain-containing protein [Cyclonatronaceae bacterium]